MRKLIVKMLLFGPLLLMICIVNYYVDIGCLYNKGLEERMGDCILQGKNVYMSDSQGYNNRKLLEYVLKNRKQKCDVIILGSSRMLPLNKACFPGEMTVYNASIPGASYQDIIAIYYLLNKYDSLPKRLYIGVDFWMYNENYKDVSNRDWHFYESEYYAGLKMLKLPVCKPFTLYSDYNWRKYSSLVSPGYFQLNLDELVERVKTEGCLAQIRNKREVAMLDDEEVEFEFRNMKFSDGSTNYQCRKDETEMEEAVADFVSDHKNEYFKGFYTLREETTTLLQALVEDAKAKNVDLVFVLPPFNPLMHDRISQRKESRYQNVYLVEKEIREIAKRNSLRIYGSYDPNVFALKWNDFADAAHCSRNTFCKYMNKEEKEWFSSAEK